MQNNIKNDNKELVNVFLDSVLFKPEWKFKNLTDNYLINKHDKNPLGIEIIVRPECNQQCEYCYIHQFGKELYPLNERADKTTLIKNFKSILDYVFNENDTYVHFWTLFAGDMFYDGLIYDLLDEFYNTVKPFYDLYFNLFYLSPIQILIPCNCAFVANDEALAKFEERVEKLKAVGVDVAISYSGDGKYVTDVREKHEVSDEFYDKLFTFLSKHEWGCHPMISAESMDNQIKNYDWWVDVMQKYHFHDNVPMFLEVRNNNWTDEKIDKYLELLDHAITQQIKFFDNDISKFTDDMFNHKSNYCFYRLQPYIYYDNSRHSCSIQQLMHINLNNLKVSPCHRLTYKQFHYFQFLTDDNGKIVDVDPKNISLGLTIYGLKANFLPRCATCEYNDYCLRGCFGSQYETNGELFTTCPTVCKLMKAKIDFLVKKYYNIGVLDNAVKNQYISQEQYDRFIQLLGVVNNECRN